MFTTVFGFVATRRDIVWSLGFLTVGMIPRVEGKAWKVFVTNLDIESTSASQRYLFGVACAVVKNTCTVFAENHL